MQRSPSYVLLVHFKSKDLARLHKQGQFWHIFFFSEGGQLSGAIISQDEVDTWTTHLFLPLDMDDSLVDSHEAVYKALGGLHGPYPIQIDEVLVRSTYRPNIAMARNWISQLGKVFLAGDAAHQNIPTGGYGMNTGIADAFDLGWKLAAVVNGFGGEKLMHSYEEDRRPVATQAVERSGVHMAVHLNVATIVGGRTDLLIADSEEGMQLRQKIAHHYQLNDGENKDLGIEMGYRYRSSICVPDHSSSEPVWDPRRYVPTTMPGSRVPHVFLRDGTPIFDLFGKFLTLVEFADDEGGDHGANLLLASAEAMHVALKHVRLVGEEHARRIWVRRLTLVRPDFHSAWRGMDLVDQKVADEIILRVIGVNSLDVTGTLSDKIPDDMPAGKPRTFTSTVASTTQTDTFELDRMGDLQR
jgi:FAD-dependent monooxygenase